jgi:hypothetical protein
MKLFSAHVEPELEARAFLAACCSIAMDLYHDLDWNTVEPKLERSWGNWQRVHGYRRCRWADVRDAAHERWDAAVLS